MHATNQPPEGLEILAADHQTAARMISVSDRKLAELVAEGKIRRAKAGTKNLFPVSELKRFLLEQLA